MSRNYAIVFLACWGTVTTLLLATWPDILSDENSFFEQFFDQDFISFLAVLLTISIGLLAQLFVSVGKLGDKLGAGIVSEIRNEMRNTVKWLLAVFFLSLFLVALKPTLSAIPLALEISNSILMLLLVYYLLILSDVVLSVFDFDL